MKPQDAVGRIRRDSFVISTSTLLALVVLGVTARFVIRFRVQKLSFFFDYGFLIAAFSYLLVGLIVMHLEVLDRMCFITALQSRVEGVIPPPDWIQMSFQFHKWVTVCNMLAWCAVMSVKFSFMFFFKKLIDRLPSLNIYWWFLVVYSTACWGYGISVYYIGCPYYFDLRELQCASGPYKTVLVHHSTAQMVLDLIGDVLTLALPACILWKTRVQWSQKIALMFSLCLTAFMIATTIARVSGLIYHGMVDTIWETYWTLISAEVGVFMAAGTAFRTFFVTRSRSKSYKPQENLKYFFPASFAAKFGRKRADPFGDSLDDTNSRGRLPRNIPRAHMTGMRTFIDEQGEIQPTTQTDP